MRNLSVMEQKQVVGGYYVIKYYSYTDASDWGKEYTSYLDKAKSKANWYSNNGYHAIVVDVSTGKVVYDVK